MTYRTLLSVLCLLIGTATLEFTGCKKRTSDGGHTSFRFVTDQERQILEAKLAKLVETLRKGSIPDVQNLMHPSKKNEFTIDEIRHVEEFRGKGWFANLGTQSWNAKPSIAKVRYADDKSLVMIDGLGVTAFFKEIEGDWYFDGWAK